MAKRNSPGLGFELLEDRCLLSGAVFAAHGHSAPDLGSLAHAPADHMSTPAVIAPNGYESTPKDAFPSVTVVPDVHSGQHDLNADSELTSTGRLGSVVQVPVPASVPNTGSATDAFASTALIFPIDQGTTIVRVPVIGDGANHVYIDPQTTPPPPSSSQPPKTTPVAADEYYAPQIVTSSLGSHFGPQAASGEDDSSGERSPSSYAQTPPAKVPSAISFAVREQNNVPPQTVAGQALAKTDGSAAVGFILPKANQANGTVTSPTGVQAAQGPNAVPQNGQERATPGAPVALTGAGPDEMPAHLSVIAQAPAGGELGAPLSSSAALATDILPFDFSSLETSIQDFFDQIDKFGLKLNEKQVNLLFTTCLTVAAAALALETARRKTQAPPVPILVRGDFIPYSDYP